MGAGTFDAYAKGKTASEAFDRAVKEAQHMHGHGGYTGTIAEKDSFVLIGKTDTLKGARALSNRLISDEDPRVDDKWGPAGCIEIGRADEHGDQQYLFFGWASS